MSEGAKVLIGAENTQPGTLKGCQLMKALKMGREVDSTTLTLYKIFLHFYNKFSIPLIPVYNGNEIRLLFGIPVFRYGEKKFIPKK